MNKYVVVTLVMVVLLVALAEIYFALSWDEHLERGRWNITFNWTLKSLPDPSPEDPPNSWPRFLYSTQTSTKTILNSTVFNFSKTVNLSETAEFKQVAVHITDTKNDLPSGIGDAIHTNLKVPHELREELNPIDYNYPDCGFHPLDQ